jgi:tetratricopeptide (TPR) repeat protein
MSWTGRACLPHYQGDHAEATTRLTEALMTARELQDAVRISETLQVLGIVAEDSGAYVDAARFLEEAMEIHHDLDDRYSEATTLAHLGIVSYGRGDIEQAEAQGLAARALAREVGNLTAQFMTPLMLGHIATTVGAPRQAAGWFREAFAVIGGFGGLASVLERGDDSEGVARALAGVALLAATQFQAVRAARLFGMAEAARAPTGLMLTLPESAAYERATEAARNQIGETLFEDAYDEGRSASVQQVLAEVETVLGNASNSRS